MSLQLRLAFAALGLLVVVAVIGLVSGSRRADPGEAEPGSPLLDVSTFKSVNLLPPEQRSTWAGETANAPVGPADPKRASSIQVPGAPAVKPPPAAAAASAEVKLPAGTRSYRVRERDSLTKIARKEYGSEEHWRWLAEVNGIKNPGKLKIGDLIQLPPRPTGPVAAGAPATPASAVPAVAAGTQHLVKKGETIGEISQRYYGTSKDWKRILDANGLKRAEDLKAGQTLVIPPAR
jgi:nucleoid-associated protein YgaU